MIGDPIQQLRTRLSQTDDLPEATRAELLALVAAVEREALGSSDTEAAEAEAEEPPALGRLVKSMEELEASHPEVVASINQVAAVLGKMGI
jgi:hypothetical protein